MYRGTKSMVIELVEMTYLDAEVGHFDRHSDHAIKISDHAILDPILNKKRLPG